MKRLLFLFAFAYVCLMSYAQTPAWNVKGLKKFIQTAQYEDIRQNIIKKANSYIKKEYLSVTDKAKKFAPDKHYYESMGPYWWPDPNNPNGAYIRKDGERNPEYKEYDKDRMSEMANRVYYTTLAFYLTRDVRYYDYCTSQLQVWFLNEETKMHPSLEYGQIIPGKNNNHGRDAGLIEMRIMHTIIESVRLLNDTKRMDAVTYKGLQQWCKDFLLWCENSEIGKKEFAATNNHGSSLDVVMLNMAIFANYKECVNRLSKGFEERRLNVQVSENGKMPSELTRTMAYHYSIYNLSHIVDYCLLQESLGNHFYKKNRKVINSAVSYLLQYVGHKELWEYQEISSDWSKLEQNLLMQIYKLRRVKGSKRFYDFKSLDLEFNSLEMLLI